MVTSVLSVLLMGMLPVSAGAPSAIRPTTLLTVAAPSLFLRGQGGAALTLRRLSASGVLILDLQSAQSVFSRAPDFRRPIASLTKLMTALLIIENHDLQEWVTIPGDIDSTNGNVVHLPPGQQFVVGDLLSALLMASANDAADALARFHSGSPDAFVIAMNERAQALGLTETQFMNVAGFDAPDQWSTPRDLGWLAMFLLRSPAIQERLAQRGVVIRSRQGQAIPITHTHAFLHAQTPVIMGKTGTTTKAGQCLLSVVEIDERQYLVILLNSLQRYADMRAILDALEVSPGVS